MSEFDPRDPWQNGQGPAGGSETGAQPDQDQTEHPSTGAGETNFYDFSQDPSAYERGYQWNFEDYDRSAQAVKPVGRRSRGMTMFLTLLLGVLIVALVSFAGIGVYTVVRGLAQQNQLPQKSPGLTTDVPGIEINDVPQVPDTSTEDGRLTAKEVYNNFILTFKSYN